MRPRRRIFLSDVHLAASAPERTARLLAVLEREAPRTDEFYILGDLFDYWIGPKHLAGDEYREALDALRSLTAGGMTVRFVAGNRDFYLRGFAEATGIEVVEGFVEHWLDAGGRRAYLCHGDDLAGRRGVGRWLERLFRSRPVEWFYTRLPGAVARLGGRFYRWVSGRKGRRPRSAAEGHGLSEERLAARLAEGAEVVVCGHVHREGRWPIEAAGASGVLYTLGDWSEGASYLVEEDGRWSFGPAGREGA